MNLAIQKQFDIKATDFNFYADEKSPTITVKTSLHEFTVQTQDQGSFGPDCWITTADSDGHINWSNFAAAYHDEEGNVLQVITEVAEMEAKRVLRDRLIDEIIENDKHDRLQMKAKKVAAILGVAYDDSHLLLAHSLSRVVGITPNELMIRVQVIYGATQAQSREIVDLCLI